MRSTGLGGMTVKHTEFCGTLDRHTAAIESRDPATGEKEPGSGMILPLNAGEGITFPWLNSVAMRYEKYRFKSLKFFYVPSISKMYGGAVAMCPIYDPADTPPTSRRELYNAEGAVHAPVHEHLSLTIPERRLNETKFNRGNHKDLIDANELRLSDLGYLTITLFDLDSSLATTIQAAAAAYGDVFVEYEVELISPRVTGSSPKHAHFRMRGDQNHVSQSGTIHSFTGGYNSPEHKSRGRRDPLDSSKLLGHSEADTLALQYIGQYKGVYQGPGNRPVDYDCIQFKEPFCGLVTVETESPGSDNWTKVVANGINSSTGQSDWTLATGVDHVHKFAQTEAVSQTPSGAVQAGDPSHQTFKVIAEAGEVLALAYEVSHGATGLAGSLIDSVANMTWLEMGEVALDLLIGLL